MKISPPHLTNRKPTAENKNSSTLTESLQTQEQMLLSKFARREIFTRATSPLSRG
jgi:hypothetical protein